MGKKQRATGLADLTDEALQALARDRSASKATRRKEQTEEKNRRLRNVQKRQT